MIYLLLNKLTFHHHSGPRFTCAIELAQNPKELVWFRRAVPVIEGNHCSLNHGRVPEKQFTVQCSGDPKTAAIQHRYFINHPLFLLNIES